MAIKFRCPSCDKELKVPDDAAGKMGKCSKCGSSVQAPAAEDPAEAPPPAVDMVEDMAASDPLLELESTPGVPATAAGPVTSRSPRGPAGSTPSTPVDPDATLYRVDLRCACPGQFGSLLAPTEFTLPVSCKNGCGAAAFICDKCGSVGGVTIVERGVWNKRRTSELATGLILLLIGLGGAFFVWSLYSGGHLAFLKGLLLIPVAGFCLLGGPTFIKSALTETYVEIHGSGPLVFSAFSLRGFTKMGGPRRQRKR